MERKLTKSERKDKRNKALCILVKQNDLTAQTRLLLENNGLIVQLAKRMEIAHELDINHYGGIEFDDILQEGRMALLEAAKSFDVDRSTKFSTYAYTVMRNAMSDLCVHGDSAFERRLADSGITQVFLDDNPTDTDGIAVSEKVADSRERDPVGNLAVLRVMIEKMRNRIQLLPERERRLLAYHFGLNSLEVKSISETAAFFHLSENYLRAIENETLAKLRDGMNDGKII